MGTERGNGRLEYRKKLFTRSQAQSTVDLFIRYLEIVCTSTDKKLEDIVDGLEALKSSLEMPESILNKNCKVLAKLSA